MIWPCRRCLRLCVVYNSVSSNFPLSCNVGLRGTVQEDPPEAVRRRVGLFQHNTLEAQPAPGAPIAPPDFVERARSQRSGQELNPSDHYPLPHNSCSSNRTEPTALLIAVKFPGRRKNPTSVSISSTAARWQHQHATE
uniref:Uncharacterized protein n=1 Tax=Anopheles arabiensis TaxID=7173 RepID=A0A182ICL8_ANOAR